MIDLAQVYEIRNMVNDKVIDKIEDDLGNVWYEAFKKLLISGIPPLTLLKSKGEDLVDYTVHGNTYQKTYTGKNLFDKNNAIILNAYIKDLGYGTAAFNYSYDSTSYLIVAQPNSKYRISHNNGDNTIFRGGYIDVDESQFPMASGDGVTLYNRYMGTTEKTLFIETGENATYLVVQVTSAQANVTIESLMIEKTNDQTEAPEYEQYVGGTVSPNPDFPQEIQSVGEKTKNLFNPSKLSFDNTDMSSGRVEGNDILIETTSNYTGNGLIITKQKLKDLADLEVGKTYILKFIRNGEKVNQAYNRYIYILSTNKLWNSGEALTITQEMLDSVLYFYGLRQTSGEGTGILRITNFQIEEGSTVTEYEPYGYRIPIRVRGKNLFDGQLEVGFISENAGENVNTTNTLYWRTKNYIEVVDNMKCSYQKYEKDSGFFVLCYDKNKNFIGRVGKIYINIANLKNSVLLEGTKYIRIFWELQGKVDDIKTIFDYLQIEQGETTEYEPYVEPITTNIYLDEPLRKIGDYKDYIDFDTKTFYKKIFEYVFTGNEYWASPISPLTNTIRSYASNIFSGRKAVSFVGLSEKGIFDGISTNSGDQERCQYVTNSSNSTSFYARILKSRCADPENPVANDFKNIYTKGTKVYGVFDTPIEETIELPNIPTHKGTTIIEVNTNIQPSNMEVTYLGKQS